MIMPVVSTPSFRDFTWPQQSVEQHVRLPTSGSSDIVRPRQQLVPLNGLRILAPTPAGQIVKSLSEQLFDKSVQLKVQISQFAMHLSREDRSRTFQEIDRLLNVEDWYEEDQLPNDVAFQELVKWAVYAKNYDWTSLGISNSGAMLVAWRVSQSIMTATFSGVRSVRWTVRMGSKDGDSSIVGQSPLLDFARQSDFYLAEMRSRHLETV